LGELLEKNSDTHNVYKHYRPEYLEMDDGEKCIEKAHYRFCEMMDLTYITIIAVLLGLLIAGLDDNDSKWFSGILLVCFMMKAALLGRDATVHLCIMGDVGKEIECNKLRQL